MNLLRDYYDYIVIGASQAGISAVKELKKIAPRATLLLINGEDRLPYKRTHLTKKLAQEFREDDFALYEESWYRDQNVHLIQERVTKLDGTSQSLVTERGKVFFWGKLLLASGAVPRIPDIPGNGVEAVELAEQCALMGLSVHIPLKFWKSRIQIMAILLKPQKMNTRLMLYCFP